MSDENVFQSTTVDLVFHYVFASTGFFAIISVYSPISFLVRKPLNSNLQKHRTEQKKLGVYRWFLMAIAASGVWWDVHLSMFLAPFPLLPYISFWADGLLVYVHQRAVVYLMAFALFLIYFWLTTLLLAFLYRFYTLVEGIKKRFVTL
ncbi:hypothetical protein PFISCL1PPCAC_28187, partial [Pristionchus fissidentatus]